MQSAAAVIRAEYGGSMWSRCFKSAVKHRGRYNENDESTVKDDAIGIGGESVLTESNMK